MGGKSIVMANLGIRMKKCEFCDKPTKRTDGRFYDEWFLCLDCVRSAVRQMMERSWKGA